MRIKYLVWDNENIKHILRHNVTQKEVEEVCKGRFWFRKGKDKRCIFFGQTFSGRYIFLVMRDLAKGNFRPVTARDMTEREKKSYRKKVK